MKRKVLIICFILVVLIISSTNSFANDYSEEIKGDEEKFGIDVFFEKLLNNDAIIVDDNGLDISDKFVEEYYPLIINNDYDSLIKILSNKDYGTIENIKIASSENNIKGDSLSIGRLLF